MHEQVSSTEDRKTDRGQEPGYVTYILVSVILTLRSCSRISLPSSCSPRVFSIALNTLPSFVFALLSLSVLRKKLCTSCIVSKGGSSEMTSSGSSLVEWVAISESAGGMRSGVALGAGRGTR